MMSARICLFQASMKIVKSPITLALW